MGARTRVRFGIVAALIGLGGSGPSTSPAHAQTAPARYRVQALVTEDLGEARARARTVYRQLDAELPVYVVADSDRYRVRAGDHADVSEARGTLRRLQTLGYADAWIAVATTATPTEHLAPTAAAPAEPRTPAPAEPRTPTPESEPPASEPLPRAVAPHGVLEAGDCDAVFGWAWDSENPGSPVRVEILDGDRRIGDVVADRLRPDLARAEKGEGRHGFSFRYPERLTGARTHRIRARVEGADAWLVNTPLTVECVDDGGPPPPESEARPASAPAIAPGEATTPPRVAESDPADGVKRMTARRLDAGSIVLDGRLSETAWTDATFDSRFRQKGPDRSFPPRERTEVAFAYDDEALYVGARMHTARPEELRGLVRDRDDPGNAERILVSLDTYGDGRTAYTFGVTTGGVRLDHLHPTDDELDQDRAFDPVWEARARIDSVGWSAEFRIPFSELRFDRKSSGSWGLNIRRWSPERFLNVYWVVVPLYESGWVSRFGRLEGLEALTPRRSVVIRPYALAGATLTDAGLRGPTDPASTLQRRIGADAAMDLGSGARIEATINPDFGQIEADPAEVNLTQFETFFEERRPFFSEGNRLIAANGPRYFYSRRVGGLMPGGLPGLYEAPTEQTILGAARATGRLESGLSFGSLIAVTGRETGPVTADEESPVVEAAAPTVYGVGRVEKTLGPAGSSVGAIITGVRRSFAEGSQIEGLLPSGAITGGVDWRLRLRGGDVEVTGFAGFSRVSGDSAAILRVQRASSRYFQRPDAGHVGVDSSATALGGWTAGVAVKELAGQWLFEGSASYESPGLELQDAGILASTDDIEASGGVTYRQPRAGGWLREYSLSLFLNASWNTEGVRQYTSPSLYARGTLPNLWRAYVQAGVSAGALSDDLTRGGPLMGTPSSWSARLGLLNRFGAPSQWSGWVSTRFDEFGGWSVSANGGFVARPGRKWELSIHPGVLRSDESRQFFGTFEGGPDATFGTRYVFSRLDRTEVYAQLRAGYSVTPDLVLQIYVEPFASSGRFHDFGELDAARSADLRQYGSDGTTAEILDDGSIEVTDGSDSFTLWNSDFHVRSFRTNAVLRWEWLRGSTLHLIWQQNRWSSLDTGDAVGLGSLFRAPGDAGEHILAAKVSYWLPIR